MINGKRLVALCTSRVYDPQIHGYIENLNKKLTANNCALLIFAINSDIYWEEDRQATEKYVFNLIPYDFIDAVIIMDEKIKSHKIASKIIKKSKEKNIPVIISDGTYENVSCINFNYEKGFEQVVRHIIEYHGIKKPHMMAGQPDNDFSNHRIDVFKKVLAENNIPFDDSMLSYGYFWSDPCRIAMEELLSQKELPEAIICANDAMAITASEMLQERGFRIPEDIIISGFDGYDEIYFSSPKITTASCDILLLSDATAEVTLEAMADGKNHNKSITPVFIANESCGCHEYTAHPKILRNWFKESFSRHNDDNRVLQRITSSMQISQSLGEVISHLESYKTDSVLCIVDRNCFVSENNYFTDTESEESKKEFIMVYDADYPDRYKPETFKLPPHTEKSSEDVLSYAFRDRIFELIQNGYPLIFNALTFMNRAFGFICFHYRNYYISNYSNTMNVTNAISIGFGGYINIRYQKILLDKVDEMYRHDPLTGLYNRIGFIKEFNKRLSDPDYQNKDITVIMSDLDGLKYINDNFGHAEGDNSIATVANALFSATPENSLSARFGGDEIFSVIFGECDPHRIIRSIDNYLIAYNVSSLKKYIVSTSCGFITKKMDENFDIVQAVKEADEEMYKVKNQKHFSS